MNMQHYEYVFTLIYVMATEFNMMYYEWEEKDSE